MAKWSYGYRKRLPNEAFLYVNKQTGDRKLPVLNAQGNLSVSHLNNAEARLNQTKGISRQKKTQIRKEINKLQKLAKSKRK